MAAAQEFFTKMRMFSVRLTTGIANTDGTGSPSAVVWWSADGTTAAGAVPSTDYMLSGFYITSSSATGVGNPADSLIQCYAVNKATSAEVRKVTTVDIGDPPAGTTASPELALYVPMGPQYTFSRNTELQFSISVTPTAGNVDILGYVMAA